MGRCVSGMPGPQAPFLTGHTRSVVALKVANPGGAVISVSNRRHGSRVGRGVGQRGSARSRSRTATVLAAFFGLAMQPPRVAVPSLPMSAREHEGARYRHRERR